MHGRQFQQMVCPHIAFRFSQIRLSYGFSHRAASPAPLDILFQCHSPGAGQAQIIATLALAEIISEAQGTHYTKGGSMPTIIFPPIDFSSVDPVELKKRQSRELNNGRLAMIGIMSFIAAANVPGSVPILKGNPAF